MNSEDTQKLPKVREQRQRETEKQLLLGAWQNSLERMTGHQQVLDDTEKLLLSTQQQQLHSPSNCRSVIL